MTWTWIQPRVVVSGTSVHLHKHLKLHSNPIQRHQASQHVPSHSFRHDGSGLWPEWGPLWEWRSFPDQPPLQVYVHRRSYWLHPCVHPEACWSLRPCSTDGQHASWPAQWPELKQAPAGHYLHVRWVFREYICGEGPACLAWNANYCPSRVGGGGGGGGGGCFITLSVKCDCRWLNCLTEGKRDWSVVRGREERGTCFLLKAIKMSLWWISCHTSSFPLPWHAAEPHL